MERERTLVTTPGWNTVAVGEREHIARLTLDGTGTAAPEEAALEGRLPFWPRSGWCTRGSGPTATVSIARTPHSWMPLTAGCAFIVSATTPMHPISHAARLRLSAAASEP